MDNKKVEKALEFMDHQMLETSQQQQASINQMVLHFSISDHPIRTWVDIPLVGSMIEVEQAFEEVTSRDLTAAQTMLELIRAISCLLDLMVNHNSKKDKLEEWEIHRVQWSL